MRIELALGHIVVGADFQSDDLVDRVASAGHDDEAAAPVLTPLPGDGEAVLAWKAQIEQHQCRRIGWHALQQVATAVQLRDPIAVALQVVGLQLGDVDFVVDDGDVGSDVQGLRFGC